MKVHKLLDKEFKVTIVKMLASAGKWYMNKIEIITKRKYKKGTKFWSWRTQ